MRSNLLSVLFLLKETSWAADTTHATLLLNGLPGVICFTHERVQLKLTTSGCYVVETNEHTHLCIIYEPITLKPYMS